MRALPWLGFALMLVASALAGFLLIPIGSILVPFRAFRLPRQ